MVGSGKLKTEERGYAKNWSQESKREKGVRRKREEIAKNLNG